MKLKLKVRIIRELLKKHPDKDIENSIRYTDDSRDHELDLEDLSEEAIDILLEMAESDDKVDGMWGVVTKINNFRNLKKDPTGKKISKLDALAHALTAYLKEAPNHWLFEQDADGNLFPVYVNKIKHHLGHYRGESYYPAHTDMTVQYMDRGDRRDETTTWDRADLKGGVLINDLLKRENFFYPTEKFLKDYEATMIRYRDLQPRTGEQFTAHGEATMSNNSWSRSKTSMVQEGVHDKLVMDDIHAEGGEFMKESAFADDSFWTTSRKERENEEGESNVGRVVLPAHPFVKMFDLDRHDFIFIHINQLEEYKWNPGLGDKLVLPKAHKDIIQVLMDTASEEMDDIIKGKSGGTICICTGEPGTGKTLTAEVTSEVVQRPLYKVNCSQLGTNETEIEKELTGVLARATRWKALLLIDEADVYVRERGIDIQQNAIVGIFLRVLEYYRGVLFLTSNRATIIDDAIMSRATAHLKYEKPLPENLRKIWAVLSEQFGMKLDEAFIRTLVKTFPDIVGRDVKSLLKLVVRYSRKMNTKPDLETFKLMAAHKDIVEAK